LDEKAASAVVWVPTAAFSDEIELETAKQIAEKISRSPRSC
jgi:hypothetical protein